jgi:hypothetical protein
MEGHMRMEHVELKYAGQVWLPHETTLEEGCPLCKTCATGSLENRKFSMQD